MPEVILPCPACGSEHTVVAKNFSPWFTAGSHVLCIDCQMQGPIACSQREEDAITIEDLREMIEPTGFESAAIAAWNRLPRALTWTTAPPKVAGWYPWRSGKGQNMTMIQIHIFNGVCGFWDGNGVFKTDLNRGEWAGPIPAPID